MSSPLSLGNCLAVSNLRCRIAGANASQPELIMVQAWCGCRVFCPCSRSGRTMGRTLSRIPNSVLCGLPVPQEGRRAGRMVRLHRGRRLCLRWVAAGAGRSGLGGRRRRRCTGPGGGGRGGRCRGSAAVARARSRMPRACAVGNCFQVGAGATGRGTIPASGRICHTVEAAIRWPSLMTSPCTRRWPRDGFSGHADHELADRGCRGRLSRAPAAGVVPVACNHLPVPGEQRRRGHGEHLAPAVPGISRDSAASHNWSVGC